MKGFIKAIPHFLSVLAIYMAFTRSPRAVVHCAGRPVFSEGMRTISARNGQSEILVQNAEYTLPCCFLQNYSLWIHSPIKSISYHFYQSISNYSIHQFQSNYSINLFLSNSHLTPHILSWYLIRACSSRLSQYIQIIILSRTVLNVVRSFASKKMLAQKLTALTSGPLAIVNRLVSHGRTHVGQISPHGVVGHSSRLLHVDGGGHGIRGDQGKKLGVRHQIKQLVQVELLHLDAVGGCLGLQGGGLHAGLAKVGQGHFRCLKNVRLAPESEQCWQVELAREERKFCGN